MEGGGGVEGSVAEGWREVEREGEESSPVRSSASSTLFHFLSSLGEMSVGPNHSLNYIIILNS